jgi:hypothetical protein
MGNRMTEGVTVAIRFDVGRDQVVARYRDLYRIPAFLQHPAFVEGALGYIRDYAMEPSPFEGHGGCAPQDAGLVAIDVPSRQILMYEDRGLATCSVHTILNAQEGLGPHPSQWETRAVWTKLMGDGRVQLKVQWQRRFPWEWDGVEGEPAVGRYVMGVGPFPGPNERALTISRLPYSMETLGNLDAAADRIRELKAHEWRRKGEPGFELEPYPQSVHVDLSPWVIHRFRLTRGGDEQFRARMAKLGFPDCGPRDQGWMRWAEEVREQPRDWAEYGRRRRLAAKVPLVTAPF